MTDIGQYIQLWTVASPASSLSNTPRSGESKHSIKFNFIYMYNLIFSFSLHVPITYSILL